MVYESKSFKICHSLSKEGKERYQKLLEQEADKILYKAKHPVKFYLSAIMYLLKNIFIKSK